MAMQQRYLTKQVIADPAHKMVFMAGPRQVDKTTIARRLPDPKSGCFNWDDPGMGRGDRMTGSPCRGTIQGDSFGRRG